MKTFYYLQSFNLHQPKIKKLLGPIITLSDSMTDLKIRSRPFLSFNETLTRAQEDLSKKELTIFPPSKNNEEDSHTSIRVVTLMNPKFVLNGDRGEAQIVLAHLGDSDRWDDDCCGAVYMCEVDVTAADDELPSSWMIKYEVRYTDDDMFFDGEGRLTVDSACVPFNSLSSMLN